MKRLRRENSELRRANEILKAASAFFAAYRESTAGRRYVLPHGRPSSFAQRNAWTAALNQIDAGVLVGGPGA